MQLSLGLLYNFCDYNLPEDYFLSFLFSSKQLILSLGIWKEEKSSHIHELHLYFFANAKVKPMRFVAILDTAHFNISKMLSFMNITNEH